MSNRARVTALMIGASLLLGACTGSGDGGSVYYDRYPYRSDIYYHHDNYYDYDDGDNRQ